jgi:excisionase family DNA binding protein
MLAADAIRLTEETANELRAKGQDERAAALERVLSVAVTALGGPEAGHPPQYLTAAQAARLLGGDAQLIRNLVARSEIQVERFRGRVLISRDALLAYFARTASEPRPSSVPIPEQPTTADRRRKFIMKGLPADELARLEALHEKMEAGQKLSRAERAEMVNLERGVTDAAAKRLDEWTARHSVSGP